VKEGGIERKNDKSRKGGREGDTKIREHKGIREVGKEERKQGGKS
jgi:hypothetical protein